MSRIRILFDAEPMAADHKAGIGYYTYGLVTALAKAKPQNVEIICHYFSFLGRKRPELPQLPNIRYRTSRIIPRQLVNMLRRLGINIPFELLIKARGDFIIYPASNGPPSLFKTPIIPVIHDLAYIDLPSSVSPRKQKDMLRFMPGILKKALFILTISESSRSRLKANYPWLSKPVLVEHIPPVNTAKLTSSQIKDSLAQLKISKPFILFVGTLEPRKNIVNLNKAYEQLPDSLREKYSLVLAGGQGWQDEEIKKSLTQSAASNLSVIQTGYVSDEQKNALYQSAELLVLPSSYEGYGMPILEAMSAGLPIAVSDIAVFHEIAGPAAIYFDPNKPESISASLVRLLTNKNLHGSLSRLGKQKAKTLSWDKIAASVLAEIKQQAKGV